MPGLTTAPLGDIAHVIQLAIAPVFLLTAVCTLLNVLTNRLGRVVDRRRLLVARLPELDAATCSSAKSELVYVERRGKLIYMAIALAVLCALLICLLIAADAQDYVRIAVELAADVSRLAALRPTLRQKLERSPLRDFRGFTKGLESAYRSMWQAWCAR